MEYSKPTLASSNPIWNSGSYTHSIYSAKGLTLRDIRRFVEFQAAAAANTQTRATGRKRMTMGRTIVFHFIVVAVLFFFFCLGCCESTSTIDTRMMVPILYTFVGGAKSVTWQIFDYYFGAKPLQCHNSSVSRILVCCHFCAKTHRVTRIVYLTYI